MYFLTIIVCTYNRATRINKLISNFDSEVSIPEDFQFELVIVDNNSTDNTRESIYSIYDQQRNYQLRYVFEEKSGLSNARNKGIQSSSYNNILFLDDDSLPGQQLLNVIQRTFILHPQIQCFALKILNYPGKAPSWYRVSGRFQMLNRGGYDLGDESRFLTDNDPLPNGSGMIISRQVFNDIGCFDTRFGYDLKKTMYIPGEETELFMKIKNHGYQIYYIHDAIINHYPETEKYELDSLCKTYMGIGYWYGSADARKRKTAEIVVWAGYPRAFYKRFLLDFIPYMMSRLSTDHTMRNYYLFQMKRTIGLFKGYRDFRNI